MNGSERRSDWLVVIGIGLVLWGGWWLLNGILAPLLWPLRAALDAISRIGWPLALIAVGVLIILTARRGDRIGLQGRRLYRSRTNRMIGGVLAGVADLFGIDPTLLRVVYAALAVFTSFFPAFVLYVIAMIVIPDEPVAVDDATPGSWTASSPPIPQPPTKPAPGEPPLAPQPGAAAEPPSAPPIPPAPTVPSDPAPTQPESAE